MLLKTYRYRRFDSKDETKYGLISKTERGLDEEGLREKKQDKKRGENNAVCK